MAQHRTRAFVLASAPFGEQDKLVHLLTRNEGILKAVAPGAKKQNNRFGALLELFNEGDFRYHRRENRDLVTLADGDLISSSFHLVSAAENIFIFHLMAEILVTIVPREHRDERLYRLVGAVLQAVAAGNDVTLTLLYFQIWVLRIEGLMFSADACASCDRQGLETAWVRRDFRGVLCARCRDREPLRLEEGEIRFILWTHRNGPGDIRRWTGSMDAEKMVRLMLNKLENHSEKPLHSARYLKAFR